MKPREMKACLHTWQAEVHHQCQVPATSREHVHSCPCGAKDDQRQKVAA